MILRVFLRPLSENRALMILSLSMSWIIATAGRFMDAPTDPFLSFLLPIADCYLLCVAAWLLKKVKLGWIAWIGTVVLLFAELFTVFYYHSLFSPYVILLVAQTNVKESSELVDSALALPGTWIVVLLTAAAVGLSVWLGRLSRRAFAGKKVVSVIVSLLILWSGIRQASAYSKLYHCFKAVTVAECTDPSTIPHLNTPFVRMFYGMAFNKASTQELQLLPLSVEATRVDSCSFKCPLIVLVIGESYNKHHTPLYEPEYLPTTPRLLQLSERGNLCVYTDAVAPFNFTSNSFKYMFTTWDDDCQDDYTCHTLFPAVFKKAGYNVHFVTNQFTTNSTDMWDMMGGTIFNQPRLSELQFTTRNTVSYAYDGELLQEIPALDSLTSSPTLLIFHLIGQHVQYRDKFPAEFARFKASDEKTPHGGEQGRQVAADYDNATLYNDYVVDSLFRMLRDIDAVALYLSDHGEEVYDWRDKYERTSEAELYPEVAHYQYEIPLMFYMSDTFMQQHADVTESIRAGRHRPFISTDLCQVLFHLAGIVTPDYKASRDILSPQYDTHRRRIIRGDVDYDELMSEWEK